jgi:hypothetical protein
VARCCWRQRQTWPLGGRVAMVLALVFASLRAWPWNYALLETARALMRAVDIHNDRLVVKTLLAVLLLLGVLSLAWRWRHLATEAAAAGCALGLGLQALLLSLETASLDDLLPSWTRQQPGRYLLEGACAAVAWLSLNVHRSAREDAPA